MSRLPSIFLSYNPGNDVEETLAIRMHTLGAVHGFRMYLPDRFLNEEDLSVETQSRINASNYYIMFSTQKKLSDVTRKEIQFAFAQKKDRSKIIVIYDKEVGKNLKNADEFTALFYDKANESMEQFSSKVLQKIKTLNDNDKSMSPKEAAKEDDAMAGFVLAGLALLLLAAVFSTGKK
ncbi:MAG: hypothetical protein ACOVSS_13800 [Bacteroidia bacterium]|jgi:hypothetical protein